MYSHHSQFFPSQPCYVTFSNLVSPSRKCSELKQSHKFCLYTEKKKFFFLTVLYVAAPRPRRLRHHQKKKDPEVALLGFQRQADFIYLFIFRTHQLNLFIFFWVEGLEEITHRFWCDIPMGGFASYPKIAQLHFKMFCLLWQSKSNLPK